MSSESRDHAFVVLAYERSPFLGACLESLQAQTRPSRVLLATSTPNDHIDSAARRAGLPITVNPERAGMGSDFNFALRASGARYVTLVHQDDVYMPGFLTETEAIFRRFPEGSLSFTGYREISEGGELRHSKVSIANHTLTAATLGPAGADQGLCGVACS